MSSTVSKMSGFEIQPTGINPSLRGPVEKMQNNKYFFQPLGRKGVYFAAEGNAFDLVHQHDYSYVC